jgi:group II intron reverse transcriptase/maturase
MGRLKTPDLPSSGQPDGEHSMSEKVSERMISSYVTHGEAYESLQLNTRLLITGTYSALRSGEEFYIMAPFLIPSSSRITGSCLKFRGHLKVTHGGLLRNSGIPDNGNIWGIGGLVIGTNNVRGFSTTISLAKRNSKETSLELPEETKPAGLVELDKLTAANLADINKVNVKVINIVADTSILKMAYARIKSEPGNMTPGVDDVTLDGINNQWFENVSKSLKTGAYQFKPARRVEIPKPQGGTRPLGVASPRDKIIQEAMRLVLEAIFEPSFSTHSHGFRPSRGCHTALKEIKNTFSAMNWFIEGDISKCFDSFDHNILIEALQERITDQVFMDLIRKALKAGYVFQGNLFQPELGTPQGSIISPILCNVLMHKFDEWVMNKREEFDKGTRRRTNPEWKRLTRSGDIKTAHKLHIPSGMANDPDYKRLKYVRYADDFIIGIIGPKEDSIRIRTEAMEFLKETLKLNLNMDKTKITHATEDKAMFLGTLIRITPADKRPYRTVERGGQIYTMRPKTRVQLMIPIDRLVKKLSLKGLARPDGEPKRWTRMIVFDDAHIINHMRSVYRGLANYYSFADNYGAMGRIYYIIKYSCMLTLVSKHKLRTKKQGFKKYGKDIEIRKDDKLIASFPNEKFANKKIFHDNYISPFTRLDRLAKAYFRTTTRLDSQCIVCNNTENLEMHHVKHIRKATEKIVKDHWTRLMSHMNRKQVPVCRKCHDKIHQGIYDGVAIRLLAELKAKKEINSYFIPRDSASTDTRDVKTILTNKTDARDSFREYLDSSPSDFDLGRMAIEQGIRPGGGQNPPHFKDISS